MLASYPLSPMVSELPSKNFPASVFLSPSTTCKSCKLLIPPLKPNTSFSPLSPLLLCPKMSYIPNVASLSLEFLWNFRVYVNPLSARIKTLIFSC